MKRCRKFEGIKIAEFILSLKTDLNSNVNSSSIDFCRLAVYYCFDNLDLKDIQIIIKNKEIFIF
ncbi:hypothetical protein APU55_08375 [Campylobacter jejuni]|nr:hypothetical protein [Campylobacter jejuni]